MVTGVLGEVGRLHISLCMEHKAAPSHCLRRYSMEGFPTCLCREELAKSGSKPFPPYFGMVTGVCICLSFVRVKYLPKGVCEMPLKSSG